MATYSGTPKTWTAGETLLASDFNAEIRDPIAALSGAWTSWTPVAAQGSAVGLTVGYSKYVQIGKYVTWAARVESTGAGSSGSPITLTTPASLGYSGSSFFSIGSGFFLQAGAGTNDFGVIVVAVTGDPTKVQFRRTDGSATGVIGADPAFAIASGDILGFTVTYEAA